jgi:hypothetical protein
MVDPTEQGTLQERLRAATNLEEPMNEQQSEQQHPGFSAYVKETIRMMLADRAGKGEDFRTATAYVREHLRNSQGVRIVGNGLNTTKALAGIWGASLVDAGIRPPRRVTKAKRGNGGRAGGTTLRVYKNGTSAYTALTSLAHASDESVKAALEEHGTIDLIRFTKHPGTGQTTSTADFELVGAYVALAEPEPETDLEALTY